MSAELKANLISGRTIQQGRAIEGYKHTDEYTRAAGIVEIDPEDMKKLKIYTGTVVKVSTEFGSVNVRAVLSSNYPHPGLIFIPMGPWANAIINTDTSSVGMPSFKGVPSVLKPVLEEKVLSAAELMRNLKK